MSCSPTGIVTEKKAVLPARKGRTAFFYCKSQVITVAQSALDAVPRKYYEGALALGANHERAVFRVIVPAATSGIMAGIVLGIGRAIGETMAVIMVAGNQAVIPGSIFRSFAAR